MESVSFENADGEPEDKRSAKKSKADGRPILPVPLPKPEQPPGAARPEIRPAGLFGLPPEVLAENHEDPDKKDDDKNLTTPLPAPQEHAPSPATPSLHEQIEDIFKNIPQAHDARELSHADEISLHESEASDDTLYFDQSQLQPRGIGDEAAPSAPAPAAEHQSFEDLLKAARLGDDFENATAGHAILPQPVHQPVPSPDAAAAHHLSSPELSAASLPPRDPFEQQMRAEMGEDFGRRTGDEAWAGAPPPGTGNLPPRPPIPNTAEGAAFNGGNPDPNNAARFANFMRRPAGVMGYRMLAANQAGLWINQLHLRARQRGTEAAVVLLGMSLVAEHVSAKRRTNRLNRKLNQEVKAHQKTRESLDALTAAHTATTEQVNTLAQQQTTTEARPAGSSAVINPEAARIAAARAAAEAAHAAHPEAQHPQAIAGMDSSAQGLQGAVDPLLPAGLTTNALPAGHRPLGEESQHLLPSNTRASRSPVGPLLTSPWFWIGLAVLLVAFFSAALLG